jgi:O-antigen ligase
MRRIAWGFLLLFAFAIPWEYSLELGEPWGNIARVAGVLTLLAAIPAVLQAGKLRTPSVMLWLVLGLYLYLCCSYFWTVDQAATLEKMRGYFQEMMIAWLVWEFAGSAADLRDLMRAYVAGAWVLAILTLASFAALQANPTSAVDQIRFAAEGQDPNDVARFLDLGFPFAALLLNSERGWPARLLALGYLPVGLVAVLLTASRGGFLAAVVALAGSAILLAVDHPRRVVAGAMALPAILAGVWFSIPHETLERLATIPEQLQGGDLNQRLNIWTLGWKAFERAPVFGSGVGSFTTAAGLSQLDTAHNTALSIVVGGGLCALSLVVAIAVFAVQAALQTHGSLRLALGTALVVWMTSSLVSTLEESRATWLLLGVIAVAGRLAAEEREDLAACFDGLPKSAATGPGDAHDLSCRLVG